MLTLAAVGMFLYGAYSCLWSIADVIRGARLEWWAEAGVLLFGLLLVLSAAFVRVRLPGGLAFAIGAMLGLQALAVHNGVHLDRTLTPQIARGIVATVLVGLAALSPRG
jgi:hypothetical protein